MKDKSIVIVAGEASGDLLGASLIREIRHTHPEVRIYGVGGQNMKAAGQEQWSDYQPLAVFGLIEVLKHLPALFRFKAWLLDKIHQSGASLYIGIDAPDFNIRMEKQLKAQGLKTVHYVSPSIWAWREGRAKKFIGNVDSVICLFPMEPPLYAKYQVPNVYIGHPLADEFELVPDQDKARHALDLPSQGHVIGLLPGSRLGEIYRLAPAFLLAAIRILRMKPDAQFLIPMANAACRQAFEGLLQTKQQLPGDDTQATDAEWKTLQLRAHLIDGQSRTVMQAADSLILASGTAALEGLLAKRPMVVAYRISPITYRIAKLIGLVKIDRYSLPNILANEAIVPELIQYDCTPMKIAATWHEQITSTQNPQLMERFTQIHHQLKQGGAAQAASTVMALID